MSETFYRILFIFIDVILPLAIGYYLHKYKIISVNVCNFLLKVNIRFIMIIIGLGSFWLIKIDHNLFLLAFVGIILISALPGILAYPYASWHLGKNIRNKGAYLLSSMLSNTGILGGLCAYIAMGQLAYAYVQVIGMVQNIFTLSFCFPLAEYFHQKATAGSKAKFQPHWRSILISWNQIGLLSMFVGAILNICEVPRPDIFDPIFNASVHLGAWFGILPVGYLLNFKAARLYKYIALAILPVRFIIIPVLAFIIATIFTDDILLISVITLISLCPIGINAIVVTQLYKLNTSIAEATFLISTAVFIFIAYPIFLFLMV